MGNEDRKKRNLVIEALTSGHKSKAALSDLQREERYSRWENKTFSAVDALHIRADHERALLKTETDPERARQASASATVRGIFEFQGNIVKYGMESRAARQGGGFNSCGSVDASERPSRDQVLRAIRRELGNYTPKAEIARRVHEGGIALSIRQIRNIGQTHGLLPRRSKKGKR